MGSEDEKRAAPRDTDAQKTAADRLQKQIDALVRGEARPAPRTLRDLAGTPKSAADPAAKKDIKPKPE